MAACFVCAKHRDLSSVPGGEIAADAHAVVSHLPLATPAHDAPEVYLGYLFVEPRRHVAELAELDRDEAASVGQLTALAARGLQRAVGADHVYAAVIGHRIWWTRVDEWPGAPRGDAVAVAELADRVRTAILDRDE